MRFIVTILFVFLVQCAPSNSTKNSYPSTMDAHVAECSTAKKISNPSLSLLSGVDIDQEFGSVKKGSIDASKLEVSKPVSQIVDYGGYKKLEISFDSKSENVDWTIDYGTYKICSSDTSIACQEGTASYTPETEVTLNQNLSGVLQVTVSGCAYEFRRITDVACGPEVTGIATINQGTNLALADSLKLEDQANQKITDTVLRLQKSAAAYVNAQPTELLDNQSDQDKALLAVAKVLMYSPHELSSYFTSYSKRQDFVDYETQTLESQEVLTENTSTTSLALAETNCAEQKPQLNLLSTGGSIAGGIVSAIGLTAVGVYYYKYKKKRRLAANSADISASRTEQRFFLQTPNGLQALTPEQARYITNPGMSAMSMLPQQMPFQDLSGRIHYPPAAVPVESQYSRPLSYNPAVVSQPGQASVPSAYTPSEPPPPYAAPTAPIAAAPTASIAAPPTAPIAAAPTASIAAPPTAPVIDVQAHYAQGPYQAPPRSYVQAIQQTHGYQPATGYDYLAGPEMDPAIQDIAIGGHPGMPTRQVLLQQAQENPEKMKTWKKVAIVVGIVILVGMAIPALTDGTAPEKAQFQRDLLAASATLYKTIIPARDDATIKSLQLMNP